MNGLTINNLMETVADNGKMDLIFSIEGTKIIARGVEEFNAMDEFYFDNEENLKKAVASAREITEQTQY